MTQREALDVNLMRTPCWMMSPLWLSLNVLPYVAFLAIPQLLDRTSLILIIIIFGEDFKEGVLVYELNDRFALCAQKSS